MSTADLIAFLYCDLGSILRGRSVPAADVEARLATGVGWVPANQALMPLGAIAEPNPFGSVGDLRLKPDPSTRVRLEPDRDRREALELLLCDAVTTDGEAWPCCPRAFLRSTLAEVERELGATPLISFEHEFQLVGDDPPQPAFSLAAQRAVEPFGSAVMGALISAGVEPELFVPEYGAQQFEIPCAPARGLAGADRSIVLKEVVREIARSQGRRATFTPLLDPDAVGNGAHVHLSLVDADGRPLLYDEAAPGLLSELGSQFAAGVLAHARALTAFLAPSPLSAARLVPHRWSVGAIAVGERHRECFLRIPAVVDTPTSDVAHQFNLECRAVDATANPYLAVAAIICAGLGGVRRQMSLPVILDRDLDALTDAERADHGVGALPRSLEESLDALASDTTARGWLPEPLYEAYMAMKTAEVATAARLQPLDLHEAYAAVY